MNAPLQGEIIAAHGRRCEARRQRAEAMTVRQLVNSAAAGDQYDCGWLDCLIVQRLKAADREIQAPPPRDRFRLGLCFGALAAASVLLTTYGFLTIAGGLPW